MKEFVSSKYVSGVLFTGLFGFLTLCQAEGPTLRDIEVRFTAVDPSGERLAAQVTRTVDLLRPGKEELLGYHFGRVEGPPGDYRVEARISWQVRGVTHEETVEAVYRFPLRAPRSLEGLSSELVPYILKWETVLERVAAKVGPECDFWSVRTGPGGIGQYSLGLSVPTPKFGEIAFAGIGIDLQEIATAPRIVAAGLTESWDCPYWPTPDEPEDARARLLQLDGLLKKWIPAFFDLLAGKGRSFHRISAVRGVSTKLESEADNRPGPPLEEVEFLQHAFRLLHPKLSGSPLIFSAEIGGTDFRIGTKVLDPIRLARLPDLTSQLLDHLSEVNDSPYPTPEGLKLAAGDLVAIPWDGFERDYYQVYPESAGSFSLSRPAFSADGKVAAIRHGYSEYYTTLANELCLFKMRAGRWVITERLDEFELYLQFHKEGKYTQKEMGQFQEQAFRSELLGSTLTILNSEFRTNWDQWARLRTEDGSVVVAASSNWLDRQLSERGSKEVFVSLEPLHLCQFSASSLLEAVNAPYRQGPELPLTKGRDHIVDRLARFTVPEASPVKSLIYLGHQPTQDQYGLDFFTATLKTGEELPPFTVTHPDSRELDDRLLERWIFLYFFTCERLLAAVERYIQGPESR